MKKKKYIIILALIVLVTASCLWAAFTLSQSKLSGNVDRRAFDELSSAVDSQAAFFTQALEQEYKALESMAYYFGTLDDFDIANESDVTNACVLANDLCMLGYADLEGNAVSYEGDSIGNIADRTYFKEATFWKGARSIEYIAKPALVDDPRILLAVPLLHDNVLSGVLFASKEIEVFEQFLLVDNFGGKGIVFITDSKGTVIAGNDNSHEHVSGTNLFDDHTTEAMQNGETAENIIANMKAGKSGSFILDHGEKEYVVYKPIGVNDWNLFSMVPGSVVTAKYAANKQQMTDTARTLAIAFVIAVLGIAIVTILYLRHDGKDKEIIRRQAERHNTILNGMKGAVYNYDIATREIEVTDAFERLFGYTLPPKWLAEIQQRIDEHPEFDYKAIAEARNKVELTGESTEVTLCAQTKTKGLRWFRITFSPMLDESKQLISIYGVITDITEERDEYIQARSAQEQMALAINNLVSMVISANLTQNTFTMLNYSDFTTKAAPEEGVFDDLITIGASTVPEADRQKFIDAFSRGNLLAAFAKGEKRVELEHRQLGDDGVTRWIRTTVLLVDNPYDSDVRQITLARDVTESRAYQELLQKTYDLTIENMPDYAAKWLFAGGDVLLIDANQKYLDFMGITAEEAFNKSIIYGFTEEEKQQIIDMLYSLERDRKSIAFTSRACKATGDEVWLKVQASFFEEKDGKSVYYGTLTEITELVTARMELERANAELVAMNSYRELVDTSADGGTMVRSVYDGQPFKLYYISPGLLNTMGYTEEEFKALPNDTAEKSIHPDDAEQAEKANRTHNGLGDNFRVEFRYRHRDGHYVWMQESSQIVEMQDGALVCASLVVNISPQKELEQRLRISEEEYRIAAALSDHSVFSFDIKNKTLAVIASGKLDIKGVKTIAGIPESVISDGYVAPESTDAFRKLFASIERDEQNQAAVLAFLSPDGQKRWAEVDYSITHDDNGAPATAILSFEDITAKKQAEELFNISSTFLNYTKNAAKLLVLNLSAGTIEYETEGPHGFLVKEAKNKNIQEVLEYTILHTVLPEDAQACADFFAPSRLLAAFENETVEESFEYRGLTASGVPHWMNVQTRSMRDDITKDVLLYVVFSDINEQKLAELELLRRAQTDSLTGLLNRESFEAEFHARCSDFETENDQSYNAIVMIDIDKFKQVNDTLGHDAGDETLQRVAKQLRKSLRDDDVIARFGGDEFIVLLSRMPSIELIEQRCARVCKALDFQVSDELSVSGSMGISVWPTDGDDLATLLKNADIAMYQAKTAGGNRCVRYSAEGARQITRVAKEQPQVDIGKSIYARTFGYFDLFVDGKPLHFSNAKEKELLAILIDRNGGTLTSAEAVSILWEDEPCGESQLARYRKLAMRLKNTLQDAGVADILVTEHGVRHIDVSKLDCDYYKALAGDKEFIKLFHEAYMTNYTRAEETAAMLSALGK